MGSGQTLSNWFLKVFLARAYLKKGGWIFFHLFLQRHLFLPWQFLPVLRKYNFQFLNLELLKVFQADFAIFPS